MNHHTKRAFSVILAALAAVGLAGCSSNSVAGTYFGSAGDTVLILDSNGTCGYTQDYDPEDGVQVEIEDDCQWSLSDKTITLVGVSRKGSLTGFIGEDGSISLPDQGVSWRGEIYTKG